MKTSESSLFLEHLHSGSQLLVASSGRWKSASDIRRGLSTR